MLLSNRTLLFKWIYFQGQAVSFQGEKLQQKYGVGIIGMLFQPGTSESPPPTRGGVRHW